MGRPDSRDDELGPPSARRPSVRLWVISLALLAGGFAWSVAVRAWVDNVDYSYPLEVEIQGYAYLAGLLLWTAWVAGKAQPGRRGSGCLLGLVLAIACFFALISSIPK